MTAGVLAASAGPTFQVMCLVASLSLARVTQLRFVSSATSYDPAGYDWPLAVKLNGTSTRAWLAAKAAVAQRAVAASTRVFKVLCMFLSSNEENNTPSARELVSNYCPVVVKLFLTDKTSKKGGQPDRDKSCQRRLQIREEGRRGPNAGDERRQRR